MIDKEEPEEMHPFYVGWDGEIIPESKKRGSYIVQGKIKRINNTTLIITELPIGKWTQDYKEKVLEKMLTGDKVNDKKKKKGDEENLVDDKADSGIQDFRENHTDTTVSFTVTATKEAIDAYNADKGGLIKAFKLTTTTSTNNMTAFDNEGTIRQYNTSLDILREFFNQRLIFYIARKDMLLHKMRKELR